MNSHIRDFMSYQEQTLSVNTCKSFLVVLRNFVAWLQDKEEVTEEDLVNYQLSLTFLKPSSQYKYMQVVKQYFTWLFDTGRIISNPSVRLRVRHIKRLPIVYSKDQVLDLLRAIPETNTGIRDRAMIAIAFNACLRREELLSLCMSDLNLFSREITVRTSKNSKQRLAVFSRWALSYLNDYFRVREYYLHDSSSPWLWLTKGGEQLAYGAVDNLTQRVKKLDDSYNWFSLHKLRHSIATEIARYTDNGNIGLVSEHLGHSQLDTSYQHYINFNVEDLKKLID